MRSASTALAVPFQCAAELYEGRKRSGFRDVHAAKGSDRVAMGGDVGASVVIPGAAISLKRHPDSEFLLYGDSKQIDEQLAKYPALKKASRVVHTDVTVSMHDKPSQALRRGRNSSMWLAIDAVKKGEADVAVSAGNTGALMAMARFHLHTMPGIDRPAIAGVADGARRFRRARSRRQHRRRCASSGVARGHGQRDGERAVRPEASDRRPAQYRGRGGQGRRGDPRGVGTAPAMNLPELDYIGFVEGDGIGAGAADVIVSEGFSGNIALKAAGHRAPDGGFSAQCDGEQLAIQDRLSVCPQRLQGAP